MQSTLPQQPRREHGQGGAVNGQGRLVAVPLRSLELTGCQRPTAGPREGADEGPARHQVGLDPSQRLLAEQPEGPGPLAAPVHRAHRRAVGYHVQPQGASAGRPEEGQRARPLLPLGARARRCIAGHHVPRGGTAIRLCKQPQRPRPRWRAPRGHRADGSVAGDPVRLKAALAHFAESPERRRPGPSRPLRAEEGVVRDRARLHAALLQAGGDLKCPSPTVTSRTDADCTVVRDDVWL